MVQRNAERPIRLSELVCVEINAGTNNANPIILDEHFLAARVERRVSPCSRPARMRVWSMRVWERKPCSRNERSGSLTRGWNLSVTT